MTALRWDIKLSLPLIVGQRIHGNFLPIGLRFGPMPQNGVQEIVAVGEDVRGDNYAFANRTLDGETSAIDFRLDVLDHHSPRKCGLSGTIVFARHSRYRPPYVELQAMGERVAKYTVSMREKRSYLACFSN